MTDVYYSHSYRDVPINKYFFELFNNVAITPKADQKSNMWCVAKLERYLHELAAFVSVIPRRGLKDGRATYSEYIGLELDLARRARVPRLLFVDDLLLKQYKGQFPEDAVPFIYDAPSSEKSHHLKCATKFLENLERVPRLPSRNYEARKAVVVGSDSAEQQAGVQCVCDILNDENYNVTPLGGRDLRKVYEDVSLFESLVDAELCVFLLGGTISWVHVVLAMAHAHSVPSIRLKYDPRVKESKPTLHGFVPWNETAKLAEEFTRQLRGFRRGFVEPVQVSSDAGKAAQGIGTMVWADPPAEQQYWDTTDGRALKHHLRPEYSFVRDEVDRVRKSLGGGTLTRLRDRTQSMGLCRQIYDGLRRHNFAYKIEPKLHAKDKQIIRSPENIETHECANCIDIACLVSSLLQASYQHPIMAVIDGPTFAHALAGYRNHDEPALAITASLGDVRGAVNRGDLVLFEPTGVVHSPTPTSSETKDERREADNMLHFKTARDVAGRMLSRDDITIRFVVDFDALGG